MRYIDSFTDDNALRGQSCTVLADGRRECGQVSSHFTVDARYAYTLDGLFDMAQSTQFYVGATNLLGKETPFSASTFRHANEVHDVRGRTVYGGMSMSF